MKIQPLFDYVMSYFLLVFWTNPATSFSFKCIWISFSGIHFPCLLWLDYFSLYSQSSFQVYFWLLLLILFLVFLDFPGGLDSKVSAYNAGDPGSIPGPGRSPGKGNGNPLQYSCLGNPMDGKAWQATVHGVAKNRTWLSDFTFLLSLSFLLVF